MILSWDWTAAWLIAVGLLAFFVTVWDKRCARRGKWRIAERTLWLVSALGGSLVMFLTMLAIRHKTRHLTFMIGLPLLILLQAGAVCLLCGTGRLVLA